MERARFQKSSRLKRHIHLPQHGFLSRWYSSYWIPNTWNLCKNCMEWHNLFRKQLMIFHKIWTNNTFKILSVVLTRINWENSVHVVQTKRASEQHLPMSLSLNLDFYYRDNINVRILLNAVLTFLHENNMYIPWSKAREEQLPEEILWTLNPAM